jgi:hypothetical protein
VVDCNSKLVLIALHCGHGGCEVVNHSAQLGELLVCGLGLFRGVAMAVNGREGWDEAGGGAVVAWAAAAGGFVTKMI